MRHVPRLLTAEIKKAARRFPAIILTGPRRAGKTTLLRRHFPEATYHLLEDPDVIDRIRSDPRGFLDEVRTPAILDEIQNVPEILNYVRTRVDLGRGHTCKWFLTGSQEAALMRGVTESMAGRAAVFQLLPFSCQETQAVSLIRGGFPEALANPSSAGLWFRSYIQTYLERDVRSISAIRDLATFRRFLSLLAGRSGQTLNRADIAAPLGMSIPTVSQWIGILETTMQIILVPPFYENFGKRLVKSPKLYFADSGLLCHLLDIHSEAALFRSPFAGAVFEGFIASEIVKAQLNSGRSKALYFFRDRQGLEVDFLVPSGGNRLHLIEVKASKTVRPEMAAAIQRLRRSLRRYEAHSWVVFGQTAEAPTTTALAPGVRAIPYRRFAAQIFPSASSAGQRLL